MNALPAGQRRAGVEKIVRELTDEGWSVQLEPAPDSLPAALKGFHVDLIARREGETLIGEIASRRSARVEKIDVLARKVEQSPQTRFEVFWLGEATDQEPPRKNVLRLIADARMVADQSSAAGLLVAWAALEGAVADYAASLGVAESWRSPRQLISNLYSLGALGRIDFEQLNKIYRVRSEIAHRAQMLEPDSRLIEFVVDIAERMVTGSYISADRMVEWFLEHYEDPGASVPYDSAEGGYQYGGNGPCDAEDVLRDKFPRATDEQLSEAVEVLEETSTVWVQKL